MDPIGGKRKFKENAFTAKAETGTLKVKILRKDLQSGAAQAASAGTSLGNFLSATRAKLGQQEPPRSPPKPRPNRKHVPIFYQTHAHSSSSDGSAATASQALSASSSDSSADASASPALYGGHFSSLLSGLKLGDAGLKGGSSSAPVSSLLRPPASNPLFSRNDSDGSFGDLLRHAFPSAQGSAPPLSFTPLFPGASELQQLATSSSAAYGSSLASLSTAARDLSAAESGSAPTSSVGYRFNPFTALQSAIDVHQASLSASSVSHVPYQFPHERQLQQQPRKETEELARQDSSMDGEETDEVGDLDTDLGPPPTAPPAFAIQNSLMGGGIELQPVIANVNTYNFDWSSRGGRPRSGSLPSVLENGPTASSDSSSSSAASTSASHVPMWKEV